MTTLPQTAPIRVPRPIPASTISLPPTGVGPMALGAHTPQGGGASLTPADIWRVIRANMLLIVLAAIVGGVSGYFLNSWLLQKFPKFKSVGTVSVASPSEIPEPGRAAPSVRPEEISLLQETYSDTITSVDAIYAEAMLNPQSATKIRGTKWYQSFANDPERKQNLRDNLSAGPIARSRLIRVEFVAADPLDAQIILREMIGPYIAREQAKQEATERKQIDLLKDEKAAQEFNLEQILRPQRIDMEKGLGTEGIDITGNWNSLRFQFDRLEQEKLKVRAELAGLNIQKESLDRALRDGKTPAEVQSMLGRDGRYLQARDRVDNLDIEIDQLIVNNGPGNDLVIRARRRLAKYQDKLDATREELRSDYAETMRTMLENQIAAVSGNAKSIETESTKLKGSLSDMNTAIVKYRLLQEKEKRLQDKIDGYEQEIRRVAEFRLKLHWKPVEWQAEPLLPDRPSFPKLIVTMPLAILGALALSLGIAFLRELTDTTVRSPRDIAKVGQLTLLGYIPHESDDPEAAATGRLPLAILDAPTSHIAEQFRQIRTRLQYAHALDTTRSILITSPSADDGKSTVACNLAASLALNGRQILLVDANFRRPQLHGTFKCANDVGFGDVLADTDRFEEAAVETEVPNLTLMPVGNRPANATELLESQMFADFLERALEQYDHVIFDSGPLLMVSESVAIAPRVDGVITIVRARGNSRGLLSRLRDELRRLKAEHLGVVLNAVRSQGGGYYGRNIKRYYAYQNG